MTTTTQPAKPLPPCECLTDCGDDPRMYRNKCMPCPTYRNQMRARQLHAASADLLAACIELLRITHPDLIEYKNAQAAINKATKGTT